MSTIKADNFTWKSGQSGGLTGTNVTGDQIVYGVAKAWGNFNGSTPGTNGSFNVSSFSRVSTGCYTITMSVALVDANYSYGTNHQYVSGSDATSTDDVFGGWIPQSNQTTTTFSTFTRSSTSNVINCFKILCHVFR